MPEIKTIHGIDPYAPGGLEQLFEFHRAFWGDATMVATEDDDDEGTEDEDDAEDADEDDPDSDDGGDDDDPDDGDEGALGDKGKKALDAMKKKLREAKKQAREAKKALADAQRKSAKDGDDGDEDGTDAGQQALQKANDRIKRSEVKAAAAGKLANPAIAVRLIDLDEIDIDDDGNVDEDAIEDAIADLLEKEPYLAAQGSSGKFDSARGKQRRKKQLTKADLKSMSPAEVEKARADGRLDSLMGKKS